MTLDASSFDNSETHTNVFPLSVFRPGGDEEDRRNPRERRNSWLHTEEAGRLRAMGTTEAPESIMKAMRHNVPDLVVAGDSRVRYLIDEKNARERPPTRFTEALQYYTEEQAIERIDDPLEIRQATRRRLGIDVPEPIVGERENLALFTMTGSPADVALAYTTPTPVDIGELMAMPDAERIAYLNDLYRKRLLLTGGFSLTEDQSFRQSVLSLASIISRVRGAVPANALTDGDMLRELLLDHFEDGEQLIAALKKHQPDSPLIRRKQPDVLLSPRGAIANPVFFPDATLSLAEWDLTEEEAGKRASVVLADVLEHKYTNGDTNFENNMRSLDMKRRPREEQADIQGNRAA